MSGSYVVSPAEIMASPWKDNWLVSRPWMFRVWPPEVPSLILHPMLSPRGDGSTPVVMPLARESADRHDHYFRGMGDA